MIVDIYLVLLDKFIWLPAFDRGMTAAPQDIKSLSGCYVLRSKWRPKLENWKKYDEIGPFSKNEHNTFLDMLSCHGNSNGHTHIFDHAQFDCTIIDIDRHPPTARKRNGRV